MVAGQRPVAPNIRGTQLEDRVHDLINKQRTDAKMAALQLDERLTPIARAHSGDMVKRGFFDHINPDGDNPTARGKRAGYTCRKPIDSTSYREGLAENIAELPRLRRVRVSGTQNIYEWNTLEDLAQQAVEGWMKSPGHRRNILDGGYGRTGVGVAVSAEDVFITQLFC